MKTNQRSLIFFALAIVFGAGAAYMARDVIQGGATTAEAAVVEEAEPEVVAEVDTEVNAEAEKAVDAAAE